MARTMARELAALRADEMTEDAFARETMSQWDALAERIVRRWECPPALDAEDARQEMLLALVEQRLVGKWDPARQVELSRFVVWSTCATAKAWVHAQRGALRHRGTARSRFPLSEASLRKAPGSAEEGANPFSRARTEEPDPERAAGAREVVAALLALAPNRRLRTALEVLLVAGGREDVAATIIFGDPDLAFVCQAGSVREARAAVCDAIESARGIARAA
jgi:hypothetical protein